MAISVFPAPSTASAPYPGAGSIVASSAETKGWYSTTLAAGNYVINVISGGNPIYDTTRNTYSVSAYESNIAYPQCESGTPTFVKITTSDTIFLSAGVRMNYNIFQYYFNSAAAGNGSYSFNYASVKNFDWTNPSFIIGLNSEGNNRICLVPIAAGPSHLAFGGNATTEMAALGNLWISDQSSPVVYATFASRHFAVRDNAALYTSTNAVSWSTVTLTGSAGTGQDICYGSFNGYYVLVTNGSVSTSNISSSTNGTTWSTRTGAHSQSLYSVTVGNNLYIAVGGAGSIQTSTDSITWTSRTSPQTGATWSHVAYNSTNGYYFVIGTSVSSNITAAYSTDAITWTGVLPVIGKASETIGATYSGTDYRKQVAIFGSILNSQKSKLFSGGGYFYINYGEACYISATGQKWDFIVNRQASETIYHPTYGLIGWRTDGIRHGWLHSLTASYVIYNSTI
jgi:hypothetical protein